MGLKEGVVTFTLISFCSRLRRAQSAMPMSRTVSLSVAVASLLHGTDAGGLCKPTEAFSDASKDVIPVSFSPTTLQVNPWAGSAYGAAREFTAHKLVQDDFGIF